MNPARFLLVVLFLAALAGGAWLLSEGGGAEPAEPPPPAAPGQPLLGEAVDQLEGVVIHLPQRPTIVRLRRQDDGQTWQMVEPWIDRADTAAVNSLLRSLRLSPIQELREDWRRHDDAALGLDPPSFAVELELAGGVMRELQVGAPDLSEQRFVALLDGRRIMLGVADVRVYQREAMRWRDVGVFADPGAVDRLEWFPAGRAGFAMERAGRRWRMTEPEDFLLSPGAEGMLSRLLRTRSGLIPEEQVNDEARAQLEQGDRLVLRRGERGSTDYWITGAMLLAEDRPYLLPVLLDDFRMLHSDADELRSPFLFDLVPSEIVSLEATLDGVGHVYKRRAQGWFGPDGELLEASLQNHLTELVERVCSIRPQLPASPLPAGEPAGRLVLSRSMQPLARSGAEVVWWTRSAGMPIAAAAGGSEATPLEFNLDAGVRGVLPR